MNAIKDSTALHKALKARWEELNLKNADIIKDADERGMKFSKANLSNYRNKQDGLSELQLVWLSFRYDVPVKLVIGKQTVIDGVIRNVVPAYNEKRCIDNLNKYAHIFKK
jgi:hypothetical protein